MCFGLVIKLQCFYLLALCWLILHHLQACLCAYLRMRQCLLGFISWFSDEKVPPVSQIQIMVRLPHRVCMYGQLPGLLSRLISILNLEVSKFSGEHIQMVRASDQMVQLTISSWLIVWRNEPLTSIHCYHGWLFVWLPSPLAALIG